MSLCVALLLHSEREVLFAPLTCLDFQGSHVKDEVMCIDIRAKSCDSYPRRECSSTVGLSACVPTVSEALARLTALVHVVAGLSINQMNDTIEKVTAKMRRSHLDLIALLLDDLQFAGGECTPPKRAKTVRRSEHVRHVARGSAGSGRVQTHFAAGREVADET